MNRVGCDMLAQLVRAYREYPIESTSARRDRPLNAIGFPGVDRYRLLYLSNVHEAPVPIQPPKDNKGGSMST